jgi:hypothetical protein
MVTASPLRAALGDFGQRCQDQFPQVQAPQPQPPLDAVWADSVVAAGAAANENRRRTRSLSQFGHASSAWTGEPIGRRSSNGRSQLRQMYSYVAIAQRIALYRRIRDYPPGYVPLAEKC